MYETMMHTLRAFLGTEVLRLCLVTALILIVIVLAAYSSSSFRGALVNMRDRKGWRGTLIDLGTVIFKFVLIFALVRLFIVALNFQAGIFEREHGRITERNRSAVLMKWGSPHEQHELSVYPTRKRTRVTRQLLIEGLEGGKERILTESFWKDQLPPIKAIKGKIPTLISSTEEEKEVEVKHKSIVSADVSITVTNNPRRLGNANYAGYDDVWKLKYVVKNKSRWETNARMYMPLSAKTGIFDRMYLRVNGSDILGSVETSDNRIVWDEKMAPGEQKTVEFGYSSRGLEHLRYIPKRMSQTGHYRVTMNLNGIEPHKLDYPIGSMPPVENLDQLNGESYSLTWNLDNAMSSYDIGIKLPVAEQPQYHFTHLLTEAPVGLVLLILLLVVPAIITTEPVRLEVVAIMGMLYCLHYTFMGRLADLIPGFTVPFLVSAAVTIALVKWFRARSGFNDFLSRQDPVMFAFMATAYPLAVMDADRSPFWMVLYYLAIIAYVCVLLIRHRIVRSDPAAA